MLIGNGISPLLWRPNTPIRPPVSPSPADTFEAANQVEFRPPTRADMVRVMSQPTGKGVEIFLVDLGGHGDLVDKVIGGGAQGSKRARGEYENFMYDMKISPGASLQSCAGEVDKALAAPFEAALKALAKGNGQRVVNMSVGVPIEQIYSKLAEKLGRNAQKDGAEIVQFVKGRLETPGAAGNRARQAYRKKVDELAQKGCTVVVAAGNGKVTDPWSKDWNEHDKQGLRNLLADPGSKVLSVGATDEQGRPTHISAPSNPDLAAPAVSPDPKLPNGTSWAAPYVAATIALMLEVNPRLSQAKIREILIAASEPKGQDPRYVGAGQLNRERALQLARQAA